MTPYAAGDTSSARSPTSLALEQFQVDCQSAPGRPLKDGSVLFAKLPPEVRCKIWSLLVVKPNGSVFPVHIPTYSATERFVCMDWTENVLNVTLQLEAIMQTCKLFYNDQEAHLLFYKLNSFQFPGSRECLTYVASITPSRRQAIRNITISSSPVAYSPGTVKDKKPSERLLAIASLCPSLQIFRNYNLFFQADSLTHWAVVLSQFFEIFVSQLPLLKISFRGGKGDRALVFGTLAESVEFHWETPSQARCSWKRESVSFSIRGEEALTEIWKLLRDRNRAVGLPLTRGRVRAAIASTPILTRGENRGKREQSKRKKTHDDGGSVPSAPDRIFGNGISIRGFRMLSGMRSPRLYLGNTWYDWGQIFDSDRISEAESKRFLEMALQLFVTRYPAWVHAKRASRGRRHGDWRAESKMINTIWQMKRLDRKVKLEALKKLYKLSRMGWRGHNYHI